MRKIFLAALFVFAAFAQTPTIDQSLSMKSVSSARISPDGRYVAYTVQQANWDENEFAQQIWIVMPATGERYQLTSGKKSSTNPKWSPDSTRLAFTSDPDGKRQIYIINPRGGEAAQGTNEANGVGGREWGRHGGATALRSTGVAWR